MRGSLRRALGTGLGPPGGGPDPKEADESLRRRVDFLRGADPRELVSLDRFHKRP